MPETACWVMCGDFWSLYGPRAGREWCRPPSVGWYKRMAIVDMFVQQYQITENIQLLRILRKPSRRGWLSLTKTVVLSTSPTVPLLRRYRQLMVTVSSAYIFHIRYTFISLHNVYGKFFENIVSGLTESNITSTLSTFGQPPRLHSALILLENLLTVGPFSSPKIFICGDADNIRNLMSL